MYMNQVELEIVCLAIDEAADKLSLRAEEELKNEA